MAHQMAHQMAMSHESDAMMLISQEDHLRAGVYSLLATLVRTLPEPSLLQRLSAIEASATPDAIGQAWMSLKQAAQQIEIKDLDDEFHRLFIGVGRGELLPYASWYITGFMMERPLGELRSDLARLGYQRQSEVREPEDHIAALSEVMALMIQDSEQPFASQQQFFAKHLAAWAETFFMDLENAKSARFYRAVGQLGKEFIRLEKRYLEMVV